MRLRRLPLRWRVALAVGVFLLTTPAGAAPAAPRPVDPGAAARAVFEDRDFWWKRIERVEYSSSWLERALRALGDFLSYLWNKVVQLVEWFFSLFNISFGNWSAGSSLIWLLAALLLAWALWKLSAHIRQWFHGGPAGAGRKETLEFQQLPQADALLQLADDECREGRFAEAIRLSLLALIARLQHHGLLRYDPTRTNLEYRLDLRPVPELATLFRDVARPFEHVWYGRYPATAAEAHRVFDLCRSAVIAEGHAHD